MTFATDSLDLMVRTRQGAIHQRLIPAKGHLEWRILSVADFGLKTDLFAAVSELSDAL